MLRNLLYYQLKPLLPLGLRLALRRGLARRQLRRKDLPWPIDPRAGSPPLGWPGWPDGKRFALVLTHDVERAGGLARWRELMNLEIAAGFRSAFSFVPEGDYRLPAGVPAELRARGFEIGVHDLKHDGNLYRSRAHFAASAKRINSYLKEWGAAGFRSGFMLRNLQWLHDLEIEYDSSTFDVDPFEPQPDGMRTLFPFWVPGSAIGNRQSAIGDRSPGYVELPYTLPQDSTLFLLLRERSIDIWKRKLAWIAEHGGMALLITHPDYMEFGAQLGGGKYTYPAGLYRELLHHIQECYAGQYWNATPGEAATYFKACYREGSRPARRKRVCMVSYSAYESDNRVMRYADALAERGDLVDAIALNMGGACSRRELVGGVEVQRVQKRLRNESGKFAYLWRVSRFLVVASLQLARQHRWNRYDLIHVHNVPDFLAFAAWLPKLTGSRVILDIHDILPEFYASKFRVNETGAIVRMLRLIEWASAAFADHVIVSNHLWQQRVIDRSVPRSKCTVFLNYVDLKVFGPRERKQANGKSTIIYPGGLQAHQGLDIAIRAFPAVLEQVPHAEFHIYGEGPAKAGLIQLVEELRLQGHVRFFESRPLREVPDLLAGAVAGVVPKRADSFGNEAYSTKIMEFMSQGIPVVVSRTKIDAYYFSESTVRFFDSGNIESLAKALIEVLTSPTVRADLAMNAAEYVRTNNWERKKSEYLALVDSVIGRSLDAVLANAGLRAERSGAHQ